MPAVISLLLNGIFILHVFHIHLKRSNPYPHQTGRKVLQSKFENFFKVVIFVHVVFYTFYYIIIIIKLKV